MNNCSYVRHPNSVKESPATAISQSSDGSSPRKPWASYFTVITGSPRYASGIGQLSSSIRVRITVPVQVSGPSWRK